IAYEEEQAAAEGKEKVRRAALADAMLAGRDPARIPTRGSRTPWARRYWGLRADVEKLTDSMARRESRIARWRENLIGVELFPDGGIRLDVAGCEPAMAERLVRYMVERHGAVGQLRVETNCAVRPAGRDAVERMTLVLGPRRRA